MGASSRNDVSRDPRLSGVLVIRASVMLLMLAVLMLAIGLPLALGLLSHVGGKWSWIPPLGRQIIGCLFMVWGFLLFVRWPGICVRFDAKTLEVRQGFRSRRIPVTSIHAIGGSLGGRSFSGAFLEFEVLGEKSVMLDRRTFATRDLMLVARRVFAVRPGIKVTTSGASWLAPVEARKTE